MAKKFFSVETYSDMNGEIVSITTSYQLEHKVETFEQIQDYCIEVANTKHCKGAVRNEYGIKVFDFNWSPSCENNICFFWESEERLQEFIDAHPENKVVALDPIMKQYHDLKEKHPDAVLLFRCGDFYESYEEDAEKCARTLGITLTVRTKDRKKMAGFPHHALDTYLPKLVRAGYRIAICDQLEDPKMTKKLVKRGITELVKPAVVNQ